LYYYKDKIDKSEVLTQLGLTAGQYFVVSAHREENIDSDRILNDLIETLSAIAERYDFPLIVSTHPRTQKRIDARNIRFHPHVRLLKPMGFSDYVRLQMSAKAVLSDSGTISEESSILKFPALNIREAHERPEAMEESSVMMTGTGKVRVMQALAILDEQGREAMRLVADYSMPNVSEKVLRIILSYTDYVNRVVWRKPV
jgi:UDP-N-acetylglucosamine 2-epimerase (non-hydrolysing)